MSEHRTRALVPSSSDGLGADDAATPASPDLGAALVGVALAELRHEVDGTAASERARSRARARIRAVLAPAGPHAADRLIAALGPTSREVTLAREQPDALDRLAEAKAHAVAMMAESGVSTVRGRLGVVLGARLLALAEGVIETDPKTAAYLSGAATAAIDRAREADAAIRAEQRQARERATWEARSTAMTVAAHEAVCLTDRSSIADESIDVDTSELDGSDPVERAAATVAALQVKKASILGGAAFADARDDSIRIRPPTQAHPDAARKLAKVAIAAPGTTPPPSPARKLTAAELAERGIYSDSVYVEHPAARVEREKQERERVEREREFVGGIGRLTGRVGEWRPQPRPYEPAPHEQLRALREAPHDDDEPNDESEES